MSSIQKYTLAVFSSSWLLAIAFALAGTKLMVGADGTLLPMIYMVMPFIATIILYKIEKKTHLKEDVALFFKPNKWFIFAILVPILLSIIILFVNSLFPNSSLSWEMHSYIATMQSTMSEEDFALMQAQTERLPLHPVALSYLTAIGAGLTINALFALGEEFFWRGYLYKLLQGKSFWKISFITGLLWGIWHAPIIMMGHNYPHYPYFGVIMMTVWILVLTPIFTFLRWKSGSVIAPAIMHGTLNATAGIPVLVIVGGNELLNGWQGLSGIIVLFVLNIVLYFYLKNKTFSLNKY